MNYALKFQSTDFLKSVKLNYFMKQDRGRKNLEYESPGRNFSNDATLTKVKTKIQKESKRKTMKKTQTTELMKISNSKSINTTLKICQLKPSDVKAFVKKPGMTFEKCKIKNCSYYNSLRSYDPSLVLSTSNAAQFVDSIIQGVSTETTLKANSHSNCDIDGHQMTSVKDVSSKKVNFDILPLKTETFTNSLLKTDLNKSNDSEDQFNITSSKSDINVLYDEFEDVYLQKKSMYQNKLEKPKKEADFLKMLQAYIDVTVNNNMMEEAYKAMIVSRSAKIWKELLKKLSVTNVYNQLLHIFASDWKKVSEIKKWMESDKISPNHQTFAVFLESVGRNKKAIEENGGEWESEILKIFARMNAMKISLNKVFAFSLINANQSAFILKSVRAIYPQYEIAPIRFQLNSDCNLLGDLYDSKNELKSHVENVMSLENMEKFVDDQLEVERKFIYPVKAITVNKVVQCPESEVNKYRKWESKWREQVAEGFYYKLKHIEGNPKKHRLFSLLAFMKCLPPEIYIDAMMYTVKNVIEYSGGYSPSLRSLHKTLGEQIHQRYQVAKKEKTGVATNLRDLHKKYCEWFANPSGPAKNSRQQWQLLFEENFEYHPVRINEILWPEAIKVAVGKFLYDIILKKVKFTFYEGGSERSASVFYSILRRDSSAVTEEIKCHPIVGKLFQKMGFDVINFESVQIPMVCPPKPWKSVTQGGYLMSPVEFTRTTREFAAKKLDLKKIPRKQMYPTFDSLNSLQAIPWKINEPVLSIALEVFKSGGSETLGVPEYPCFNPVPVNITPDMTPEQRVQEYRKKKILVMEKQNKYGLWCEALYRLSLANHFRKDVFWLPQNFDFRGRVYPVPPHLNHIGGDLFRSLLVFAKGKPLGPKGLDWLKIHTINLTGTHKKSSNEERLKHANDILPDILDSAEKPLNGRRWWVKSEERWQTLGACMEIKKALESGNPEEYVCYFPVHQDGSCNGLQHYAALGKDLIGAKSVNLVPCDKPQDVYNVVTELIEKERAKDEGDGNPMAKILKGFIKRKVVKQTIMTTVYGVTHYGARIQIARQLEDMPDFPKQHVWVAAEYLTVKTFDCLKKMFTSAKEIQDWFVQCAQVICEMKDYVQWVSPLGLPILQPYTMKPSLKNTEPIKAVYSTLPNTMKQKNAFPPNFVHSLDSTHMMLTAQFCEQANVTFASIHDCFWTHPCSVEIMNRICREQFIALHSLSILKDLSNFFVNCYVKDSDSESIAWKTFKNVPKTGDFDLKEVYNSVYFFS